MKISRRDLLAAASATGLSMLAGPVMSAMPAAKKRLRFVHFSDIHIQPELGAADGVAMAVRKVLSLRPRPDFIITGGDHVMDAFNVTRERADLQFRMLKEALKPLEMPIYGVIGNHDVFGWGRKDADRGDPRYGIAMVEEQVLQGKAYRSLNIGDWHFVLLNSIQPDPVKGWHAAINEEQLAWLAGDLDGAGDRPTVVVTHVPVMSLITQYTQSTTTAPTDGNLLANGRELKEIFQRHKVRGVLQGHTHVVEDCQYLGTHYVTGGAVCGDWWRGPRLGVHPEGFTVVDLEGDTFRTEYVPYGWTARR